MKRKLTILSLAVLLGLMSGCAKKAEIGAGAQDGSSAAAKNSSEGLIKIDDGSGNTGDDGTQQETTGKQIEDQTFDVTLDGWGEVTFAAFLPKENEAGDGDVYFKLLKDGKVLFDLPGMTEDNRRPSLKFVKVAAVSFKDYNGDGKKDIIIINEYSRQGSTEPGYNEVRLYTQAGGKKEFSLEQGSLTEFLQKNHYNGSINLVMEGIARYKSGNMESGIQRNNIEKQIELLADSVELWAGTMNSEGIDYFFTVTDMDRNGRLELIVSSCQGTGLYTYSDYFEVNDTFDGLTAVEGNRMEGHSEADIIVDSAPVYYDAQNKVYYYIYDDIIRNGKEYYENKRAVSLENGKIVQNDLAYKTTVFENEKQMTDCTDREGKNITADQYDGIADTVYGSLEKQKAVFSWNRAESMGELQQMGKEKLCGMLLDSYSKFSGEQ